MLKEFNSKFSSAISVVIPPILRLYIADLQDIVEGLGSVVHGAGRYHSALGQDGYQTSS